MLISLNLDWCFFFTLLPFLSFKWLFHFNQHINICKDCGEIQCFINIIINCIHVLAWWFIIGWNLSCECIFFYVHNAKQKKIKPSIWRLEHIFCILYSPNKPTEYRIQLVTNGEVITKQYKFNTYIIVKASIQTIGFLEGVQT